MGGLFAGSGRKLLIKIVRLLIICLLALDFAAPSGGALHLLPVKLAALSEVLNSGSCLKLRIIY